MSGTSKIIRMHPLPWTHETHELSEGYSTIIYDADGKRPTLDHMREDEASAITRAVNANAELMEALEAAFKMLPIEYESTGCPDRSAKKNEELKRVRKICVATLEKAKGKHPCAA